VVPDGYVAVDEAGYADSPGGLLRCVAGPDRM